VDDRLDWVAANVADPAGRIFLRLVLMVVVPLVFSALALAVVELGDFRRLGLVGLRTVVYTVVLSAVAVAIGVLLVDLLRPGHRLSEAKRDALAAQYAYSAAETMAQARRAKSLRETLLDLIPENPLQEMVGALDGSSKGNGILAVMVFALCFGAALVYIGPQAETLLRLLEGLLAASLAIIGFAMHLAPYGVACLVFAMTSRLGGELLLSLIGFVATVLAGLALQLGVVYPLFLILVGRRAPGAFFRGIWDAVLVAFGTSSSMPHCPPRFAWPPITCRSRRPSRGSY